ncbi:reverse transcriptase family protein [Desulfosporosinus sp.]|uniref:reverse transcriptase family protein n=1 Tax=Desulfosporosinus sp. TaxID=157907 RepID=UPI002317E43B|nr:reverse transcriptase family protein [Desulfosporosinus sp.]MDA8223586.1 reverse transcriptase family protein [Desulfitobacterium hafniense]
MSKAEVSSYKLEKSFFYRLRNRRRLAKFLGLAPSFFNTPTYKKEIIFYRTFYIIKRDGKKRIINNPGKTLKAIQKIILKYLSRIETPKWLISGKRGKSYVDNGIFHKESYYVNTADIKTFYDNCKTNDVYKMFLNTFKMSPDLAGIMTDLVTDKGCLPTGSPVSQLIAYWTYNDIFKNVADIASKNDTIFSLYVDDMTFSSNKSISKIMLFEMGEQLKSVNLEVKKAKNKIYLKNQCKLITGVAIDSNKIIRVPNKLRKAIIEDRKLLNNIVNVEEQKKKVRSLIGRIRSAQQIEPNIFNGIFNEVKSLSK